MSSRTSITSRVSITLFFSVLAMLMNYMITFALTPYITKNIGVEAYGFVTLAKTISNYGIIITGCLNAFASRYISIAYHKNDIDSANRHYSSVVYANVGMLMLVVLFEVGFIGNLNLFVKIPNEMLHEVKMLFAFDITNYMLLALANSFVASCYIKNRLEFVEIVKAISYVVEAGVLIALFSSFDAKVYFVGIGLITSTVVLGLCNYYFYKKFTPELSIKREYFNWESVKKLVVSGVWNSINSIGNLLNSGLDLWVTNLMLSSLSMGLLSVVKTVSTIVSSLQGLLSKPFQPYLLKYYSSGDKDKVISLFKTQILISGFFSNLICIFFCRFGNCYYRLWTPNQDIDILYKVTIVTVIGLFVEGMVQPLFFAYTLTLKNRIPCVMTIISGLINVGGMFILLKYTDLDLYAVVGTTTVLSFIMFWVFTPIYVARCLDVPSGTFFSSIVKVCFSGIASLCLIFTLLKNFQPRNWLTLIFSGLICLIISLPVHLIIIAINKDKSSIIRKN